MAIQKQVLDVGLGMIEPILYVCMYVCGGVLGIARPWLAPLNFESMPGKRFIPQPSKGCFCAHTPCPMQLRPHEAVGLGRIMEDGSLGLDLPCT